MQRWKPEMALGVEEIDAQHQEIFRRAEAADLALGEGARPEMPAAWSRSSSATASPTSVTSNGS